MPDLGVPELLIVAVIVLLLFGPGKAADIGSSLGKSIREFRKATTEDEPNTAASTTSSIMTPASGASGVAPTDATLAAQAAGRRCTGCGTAITETQKFCTTCGQPVAEVLAAQ